MQRMVSFRSSKLPDAAHRELERAAERAEFQNQTNKLNELALFAGAGGGILGGKLLNWRTVCAVECKTAGSSNAATRLTAT